MPFPSPTFVHELAGSVYQEFWHLYAQLEGYLRREHKDDGSHGAVTADSLTLTANDATSATGILTATGAGPHTFGRVTISDTLSGGVGTNASGPGVQFDPVNGETWAIFPERDNLDDCLGFYDVTNAVEVLKLYRTATHTYSLRPSEDGIASMSLGDDSLSKFHFDKVCGDDVFARLGLRERGRPVYAGNFTAVAFSAGNFVGVGDTWTVASGDQVEFKYSEIGSRMTIKLFLDDTSTTAGGATELQVTIPAGKLAVGRNPGTLWLNLNGIFEIGHVQTTNGGSVLKIFRQDPGTTFGAYTDTLDIRGEYALEVNS